MEILRASRPLDEVMQAPATTDEQRRRLSYVAEARDFASRELKLPDNQSYRRYADLHRPYVLWNVFATEEFSVAPRTWCFPFAGCVAYRGYFHKEDAEAYARELKMQGLDVYVGGVPAYSTLGWMNDPVLNTFIHYPEPELARLLFHELAHQVVYVQDDSRFNESFATTVEEVGLERWLASASEATRQATRAAQTRKQEFIRLVMGARSRLQTVYAGHADAANLRGEKARLLAQLKEDYRALRNDRWNGFAGYDPWFAQDLNNAHLVPIATYTDLVPGFRRLLAESGDDLPRFYAAVKKLARRPEAERRQVLE
jgi:predicted aminopeptidase